MIAPKIHSALVNKKEDLIAICKKYHIRSVRVFGSAVRSDFKNDSDIDLLVEFEKEFMPGFFIFMKIQKELSSLFERQVDLNTNDDLHEYFKDRVEKEAENIYVAA